MAEVRERSTDDGGDVLVVLEGLRGAAGGTPDCGDAAAGEGYQLGWLLAVWVLLGGDGGWGFHVLELEF